MSHLFFDVSLDTTPRFSPNQNFPVSQSAYFFQDLTKISELLFIEILSTLIPTYTSKSSIPYYHITNDYHINSSHSWSTSHLSSWNDLPITYLILLPSCIPFLLNSGLPTILWAVIHHWAHYIYANLQLLLLAGPGHLLSNPGGLSIQMFCFLALEAEGFKWLTYR
jgi:hypothetical protein